jgi:ribose 5-phosphate isomerase A
MPNSDQNALKIAVARAAVAEVAQGMILGVGTGSTVDCFIDALAEAGVSLKGAISSSVRSANRLAALGYPIMELDDLAGPIDLYIDGADEIDPNLCMIKGGGAALTQEKIVASAAKRFVCIVDSSKQVETLGRFPLPIEVIEKAIKPVALERALNQIPGVVTNGIFALRRADLALVATPQGVVRLQHN